MPVGRWLPRVAAARHVAVEHVELSRVHSVHRLVLVLVLRLHRVAVERFVDRSGAGARQRSGGRLGHAVAAAVLVFVVALMTAAVVFVVGHVVGPRHGAVAAAAGVAVAVA